MTLLELIVAMTIFLLIMSFILQLVSQVQQVTSKTKNKNEIYEQQGIFFDIITDDIEKIILATNAPGVAEDFNYKFDESGNPVAYEFFTQTELGRDAGTDPLAVQKVRYTYDNTTEILKRTSWPVQADGSTTGGGTEVEIVENVIEFKILGRAGNSNVPSATTTVDFMIVQLKMYDPKLSKYEAGETPTIDFSKTIFTKSAF